MQSAGLISYSFNPTLGIFRPGAHPGWEGAKFSIPVDENNDGVINNTDLTWYIESFYDQLQELWFYFPNAYYNLGETIRFFHDNNGNGCNNTDVDSQAPVREKFDNMQDILWKPQAAALTAANNAISGTSNDYTNAILIFPDDLIANDSKFGDIGPGQGDSPGNRVWNQLYNDTTWAHELGHNISGLNDRYKDNTNDDMQTTEGASWVYINGVRWAASQVWAIMAESVAYNRGVHARTDYQSLYNAIDLPLYQDATPEITGTFLQVSGAVNSAGQLLSVYSQMLQDVEPTAPDPTGEFALVFGAGLTELQTIPFKVGVNAPPPEGYDDWPVNRLLFDVIASLPDGTEWVELRHASEVLARLDRSVNTPQVEIASPNGGEDYAHDAVVTIEWTSSDLDGGDLLHTIEYSPDNGENWIVIAANVGGQSFTWDLEGVPGTDGFSGQLRLTASDGFNQAQDLSDAPFRVGGKPPLVSIQSPLPDMPTLQCGLVRLSAQAYDPEGKPLAVVWELDGQNTGEELQVWVGPLAPGLHHVLFRATDDTLLSTQAELDFMVLTDTDCDGMDDAYEEEYGLNPLFMDDAGWDNDQDGLINLEEYGFGTRLDLWDTDGDGWSDGQEILLGTNPLDPNVAPFRVLLPTVLRQP
jgi:hypothetical protein